MAPDRARRAAPLLLAAAALVLPAGCMGPWRQRPAPPLGEAMNRREPALSGDGRLLASVVERSGRSRLLLQEQASGRVLPLPPLRGAEPHSSPSLSWNGRYLALLVQQGPRRLPLIVDRLTGRNQPLLLPWGSQAEALALAPDGRRLAVQLLENGRQRLRLFDLSRSLEPDLPGGMALPQEQPQTPTPGG